MAWLMINNAMAKLLLHESVLNLITITSGAVN